MEQLSFNWCEEIEVEDDISIIEKEMTIEDNLNGASNRWVSLWNQRASILRSLNGRMKSN